MATILSLRGELATLLSSYLGTYTLANGATTPAISVRDQGGFLAPGTTVSGIECVIVTEPEPEPIRQYRLAHSFDLWTVYLVDWGGGNVKLATAAERIIWRYPNSETFPITVPQGRGPRHQIRVNVKTNPEAITS